MISFGCLDIVHVESCAVVTPVGRTLDTGEKFCSLAAPAQESGDTISLTTRGKIFDIDGVLNNPTEKKISQELIGKIRLALFEGEIVSFNTGRSVEWVIDNILNPLAASGLPAELLRRMCVVAEKGCCWIEWHEGAFAYYRSSALSVPEHVRRALTGVVEQFEPAVFEIDRSKNGIFTIEFTPRAGKAVEKEYEIFQHEKVTWAKQIETILRELDVRQFLVDITTIAIDVQHSELGKGLGTARIVEFCKRNDLKLNSVMCFGDRRGDLEMASELLREGTSAQYVHVGDEKTLNGDHPRVYLAGAPLFDRATVRVLELAESLRTPAPTNLQMFDAMNDHAALLPSVSPSYDQRSLRRQKFALIIRILR